MKKNLFKLSGIFALALMLSIFTNSCSKEELEIEKTQPSENSQNFGNIPNISSKYSYTIRHVRYKEGLWNWAENSYFDKPGTSESFWEYYNVQNDSRERMWITEVWKPAKSAIKNMVICFAGQQGSQLSWDDPASMATGQYFGWRPSKETVNGSISITEKSVAGRILTDAMSYNSMRFKFRPDNTLFVLINDAAFYWGLSSSEKNQMENAYYDYICNVGGHTGCVETVCLIGASRGGALATRLAKRFIASVSPYNSATFLLATLDAVANDECGTTSSTATNPLNSDYKAYKTNLSSFLGNPSTSKLKMYQVIGGAKVVWISDNARAFINDGTPTFDYSKKWVNLEHTQIGRYWSEECVGTLLTWLQNQRGGTAPAPLTASISSYSFRVDVPITYTAHYTNAIGSVSYQWTVRTKNNSYLDKGNGYSCTFSLSQGDIPAVLTLKVTDSYGQQYTVTKSLNTNTSGGGLEEMDEEMW